MGRVTGRRRVVVSLATAAALLGALPSAPVTLAAEVDFGEPTLTASFSEGIVVSQPVSFDETPTRIELLLTFGDEAPTIRESRVEGGIEVLEYHFPTDEDHILPNTPIEARFRITPADGGPPVLGPTVRGVYADDRFAWRSATGDIVRVHWHDGSQAFGERALAIGEEAVARTSELLGVTETEPIDFYIYADQDAFYDALGPGTRENVGGQANADIRTLFAHISPSGIDDPWVDIVIPHELVHLVFDTAVDNPYHFPPRWLNEGLADYLSQGYDADYRATVERAAASGDLIPLDGLGGQFPTSGERFYLAYAESVSAVDFLIREHGQDALVELIRSYADGRTDDEAFQDAIGLDVAAFDAAWLADLGAVTPVRHGPQPAPAGPLPEEWTTGGAPVVGGPGAATAAPGASAPARPTVPAGEPSRGVTPSMIVLLAALVFVAAAVLLVVVRRERGDATA